MFVKKTMPKCILAVCLSVFLVLVLLPSSAATGEEQVSYIGFTSDVHGETDNLKNWLGHLDGGMPIDRFVFGGDFDYSESNCNVTAANCASLVSGAFPGAEIFTTRGNHDVSDAADYGDFGTTPITDATADAIGYNTGLVYNGADYALYVMDSSSQAFLDSDIAALAGALEAVAGEDASKPVLVVSHCPIHYYKSSRYTGNTLPLLEVLNLYPNVVFLWGHNHSQGDSMYGQINTAGYVIKYTSSATMPINFTYLSMGAMHDNFGGNNDAYGLIVTIQKGADTALLSFAYKNLSGATVSEGFVTISSCNEITGVALTGVTAPVGGAQPDMYAATSSNVLSPVAVTWTDIYGTCLTSSDTFIAGNTYTAIMTLTPAGSNVFTVDTTVTVNGAAAASTVLNGDGTLTVTTTYTAREPSVIYQLATSITSGKEYAVVFDGVVMNTEPAADTNTMSGETYNYTGLGYFAPNISGNILTFDTQAEAAAATWVFTADGGGWTIRNGDNYLFASAERTLVLDTAPHVFTYGETGSNGSQLYVTIDGTVFALCFGHGSSLSTQTGDLIYPSQHNTNVLKLYENTGSSAVEDPDPEVTVYKEVSQLTAGRNYIIVANDGAADYAVKFQTIADTQYRVGSAAVAIADGGGYFDGEVSLADTDVIVTTDDSLVWTYDDDQQFKSAADSAYYLHGGKINPATGQQTGSGDPILAAVTIARDTIYVADSRKMYAGGSVDYYFAIADGGAFGVTSTSADGTTVRLFEEVDGSGEEPPAGPGYSLATSVESGSTYVVVAKSGGNAYALTNETGSEEDTLNSAPVTVYGGEILAAGVTDDMKWLFTADGNGFDVTNGGDYLNRKSGGGLYISGDEGDAGYSDWIYNASGYLYTYSNSRENYIYLSSGGTPRTFSTDTSKDRNVTIYLYELPGAPLDSVAVTGIDAPVSGGTPDTSAAADAGAVSSVTWSPAVSGTFAGHTAYTVSVTTQAPGGYDFTAATIATLNGEPVTPVLNGDGTLTVSYTFAKTGAAPVITYERVTSITPGGTYVIVSDKDGTTRALNIVEDEDYLAGTAVTLRDDMIDGGVDGSMLWTAEPGSTGTCLVNGGQYLTRGSRISSGTYCLITEPSPDDPYSDWFYDDTDKELYITSSTDYYLYWSSGGYFRMSNSTGSGETFYLYRQNITVPVPERMEAVFTQNGLAVYPGTSLDALKVNLVVNVVYSDGSTVLLSDGDYTLSGTLEVGDSTVTVAYGGKTAAFTVTVTKDMTAAMNAVIEGTTISGDPVSGIVAQFPAVIPDDVISAGYKINSVITLGAPLPEDARITITLNGHPYLTDCDLKGKTSFKITDLFPGDVPAPFNMGYNNRTETYRLAITGTATPVSTELTLDSIISNDDFATSVVLESETFNLVTHTVSFTAGAHGRLTGTTCFTALNGTAWSAAIPILPATVADTGYNFASWSQAFPDSITKPAAFTANFAANIYHITYILGGGTNNGANPAEYAFGSTVTLASPSRAGYTFGGWFSDAGLTAAAAGICAEDSGDKAFYAKWTPSGGGGTPGGGGITLSAGDGGGTPGGGGGDGGSTGVLSAASKFTDVVEGDWHYEAVQFVVDRGLFGGTSDTIFEPATPMTRGMLATVLYRMEGAPAVSITNSFADVPAGMWYTDAALWAWQKGIASGYGDGTFGPEAELTREQLVVFLYNYAKHKGYDTALGSGFNLQAFNDASEIAEYAVEAAKWACAAGLLKGKPGDLLTPKDGASRAEVATIVKRFFDEFVDD